MPPRTALISLMVAAAAAAVAFGAWRVFRDDAVRPVVQRTVRDVLLTYKCERGHTFNAMGQAEPLKCPFCGTPAHAITQYVCPLHGDVEVSVEFTLDADGEPIVSKLRLPGGRWVDVEAGLRCPRCGQPLYREDHNSVADFGRERREGEAPRRPAIPPNEQPRPQPGPVGPPSPQNPEPKSPVP